MNRQSNWRGLLSVLLVFAISSGPMVRHTVAAPQERGGPGQGDIHKDDPCTHLPDPPGKANGIDKQCPPGGSSSGIAKGDFNGDGFADLAIAEPGAMVGGQAGAGDVIILYGSATGLTTAGRQLWYEGRIAVTGSPAAGDAFGTAMASGDFNGDGFSDLAIGIPGKDLHSVFLGITLTTSDAGAVVVLYGSPGGLTTGTTGFPSPKMFDLTAAAPASNGVTYKPDGARLGSSLAWGDFNKDQSGDLAVGAPGLSTTICSPFFGLVPCQDSAEAGGVWQLFGKPGSSGGLTLTGNHILLEGDLYGVSVVDYVGKANTHFGKTLAGGDFNGDLYTDLAIGAPDETFYQVISLFSTITFSQSGRVWVVFGSAGGLAPAAAQRWGLGDIQSTAIDTSYDHFGAALAVGDFNGDQVADLAIGVPGKDVAPGISNAGAVAVFLGSANTGLTATGAQMWDQNSIFGTSTGSIAAPGDLFGTALAAGDFNGDGKSDLAIGVPLKDLSASGLTFTNAGEVDVIYGSSTGLSLAHPPQRWNRLNGFGKPDSDIASGDHFGAALTAWNFGYDETLNLLGHVVTIKTADLAIGVPLETVNGISGAGAVNVMYGSFNLNGLHGPDPRFGTTNNQVFTADSVAIGGLPGAHFGAAIY